MSTKLQVVRNAGHCCRIPQIPEEDAPSVVGRFIELI
jgi:hypothetical protein